MVIPLLSPNTGFYRQLQDLKATQDTLRSCFFIPLFILSLGE